MIWPTLWVPCVVASQIWIKCWQILSLAKIPSGRKMGRTREVQGEFCKGFSTPMGCAVNTIRQEDTIKLTENGRRAQLCRSFSMTSRGFSRKHLRRQGRNDDANRPALASQ
jgi:hypothetical protein